MEMLENQPLPYGMFAKLLGQYKGLILAKALFMIALSDSLITWDLLASEGL